MFIIVYRPYSRLLTDDDPNDGGGLVLSDGDNDYGFYYNA